MFRRGRLDMREKSAMDGASEELERRSRHLSSLIERTKLKGDATRGKEEKKELEKGRDDCGDGGRVEDDLKDMENIRVRAADMPRELQRRAFRCARETLSGMPKLDSKRLALVLKKEFDSTHGPAWHCIVGTSFGSYVTHSLGGFLYFSIEKVYILLFRTAVEPLDHRQP
ncbi:dynein light chain 1, cytoplasmic-like [Phalaenopsis equestris]|uniref:dynein light chain 1, cytoplasmic-like n=1 Tax=Phalaenopsis equestris TaxID=78828 RepID=UPI0009E5CBE6|nr:dynein light chain 1, cytoplasmic-like [Phalaenopsis equestris]